MNSRRKTRSKIADLQTQPLETVHITEEMVHKKLQSLRSDKSPGPDKLYPRILKELAKELTTPLAIIYNKCIGKGTLPSQWKEAIVTPIFKKGCKSESSNYRRKKRKIGPPLLGAGRFDTICTAA